MEVVTAALESASIGDPRAVPEPQQVDLGSVVKFLPTPAAGNFNDGESVESWEARRAEQAAKHRNGNGFGTPLAMAVKMLPTPTTDDANNVTRASGEFQSLVRTVVSLLPTPTARDHKGANQRGDTTCLPGALTALPSNATSESSDVPLPDLWTSVDDSAPDSSNGCRCCPTDGSPTC